MNLQAASDRDHVVLGCDRLVYSERESCKWKGKYILMFHRYMCSVLVLL